MDRSPLKGDRGDAQRARAPVNRKKKGPNISDKHFKDPSVDVEPSPDVLPDDKILHIAASFGRVFAGSRRGRGDSFNLLHAMVEALYEGCEKEIKDVFGHDPTRFVFYREMFGQLQIGLEDIETHFILDKLDEGDFLADVAGVADCVRRTANRQLMFRFSKKPLRTIPGHQVAILCYRAATWLRKHHFEVKPSLHDKTGDMETWVSDIFYGGNKAPAKVKALDGEYVTYKRAWGRTAEECVKNMYREIQKREFQTGPDEFIAIPFWGSIAV